MMMMMIIDYDDDDDLIDYDEPDLREDLLLICAMRDSNVPKFLSQVMMMML